MTKRELNPIDLIAHATPEERRQLRRLLSSGSAAWRPLPGPQQMAYDSIATITGYGGAAGGGKTDLAIGLALTRHKVVGIFRQTGPELTAIIDRMEAVLGGRDGYNGQDKIWRTKRGRSGIPVQIEFGSFPNPGDEKKYRGRPHDLLVFDEAADMRRSAVMFLLGWLRTTDPQQRVRALMTFNPPTTLEGRWVVDFFAPWLDKKHPNPAKPGELRWFATIGDRSVEVEGPGVVEHEGEKILPQSRTFIPSRVTDNPYLVGTNYMAQLMAMEEPLRSQLLYGDFQAGVQDDAWQMIPTAWVERAMARWHRPLSLPPMDALGVDVARTGQDETVIARRHGMWFDVPLAYSGQDSNDGPKVAGLVMVALRDHAPIHLDVIGVGASPYDFLRQANQQVIGVTASARSPGLDKNGVLGFANMRSEMWWRMREALDPAANTGIALPPHPLLLADLCAMRWEPRTGKIHAEETDEIKKVTGRSPDYGTAYCLALMRTPRLHDLTRPKRGMAKTHDPLDITRPK